MIRIYRNPETSEIVDDEEFTRFIDALMADPTAEAQIIENGVVYARALSYAPQPDDGRMSSAQVLGWSITPEGTYRIIAEAVRP